MDGARGSGSTVGHGGLARGDGVDLSLIPRGDDLGSAGSGRDGEEGDDRGLHFD